MEIKKEGNTTVINNEISRLPYNNCNKNKKKGKIEIKKESHPSLIIKSFEISESEQEIKVKDLNDNKKNDISRKSDIALKDESNFHKNNKNDNYKIKQNTNTNFIKSNNNKKKAGKGYLPQNIDIQFLTEVNNDSWQYIIKKIYNIDSNINLDNILKNITNLDGRVNSFLIFFREYFK